MKRRLIALLLGILVVSAAACGGDSGGTDDDSGDGAVTARSIAEQACELMAAADGASVDDEERTDALASGLAELDRQQQEAEVDIADISAEIADICPEFG